jgi:HemK-related putative methylase
MLISLTEPYPPSEDTFLVEYVIRGLKPAGLVADVGCSTGYLTRVLAENALEVVATDINPEALERARENLTPVLNRVHLVNARGLPVRENTLDAVVSNPPYLPADENFYDPSLHGGPSGVEAGVEVLRQASQAVKHGGAVVVTASTLSDTHRLLEEAGSLGLGLEGVSGLKVFFEEILCFKFTKR